MSRWGVCVTFPEKLSLAKSRIRDGSVGVVQTPGKRKRTKKKGPAKERGLIGSKKKT